MKKLGKTKNNFYIVQNIKLYSTYSKEEKNKKTSGFCHFGEMSHWPIFIIKTMSEKVEISLNIKRSNDYVQHL